MNLPKPILSARGPLLAARRNLSAAASGACAKRRLAVAVAWGTWIGGAFAPWILLATRVWLAQAFLVLQVEMAMSGTSLTASFTAVWWTEAVRFVVGSGFGAAVQATCPLLLAVGALSRPAAFAILLQVVLLHRDGGNAELGFFWATLLAALVVLGPGPLALDAWLGSGIRNSAVPAVATLSRLYAAVERRGRPWLLLWLRLVLALILVVPHLPSGGRHAMADLLPPGSASLFLVPLPLALAAALLLLMGAAVRLVAAVLLLATPFGRGVVDERLYWALVTAVLFANGAGLRSVDALLARALTRLAPAAGASVKHVVVVGGGFAGAAAVRGLAAAACRITLVDRRNYHLFQPLLYQVATAGLSPGDIATPIRSMFRRQANARVLLGDVTGVDLQARSFI